MMAMLTAALAITGRGVVKTKRIPAILIQSVFFPVFFLVIYVGLYAGVLALGGFGTESVENWYLPFMMLQGAAFAGVADDVTRIPGNLRGRQNAPLPPGSMAS